MLHFLKTLELNEEASWSEIKERYREQIKVWHPDQFADDERLQGKCEEKTKQINYAYSRLKAFLNEVDESGFDTTAPFLIQYCYRRASLKKPTLSGSRPQP